MLLRCRNCSLALAPLFLVCHSRPSSQTGRGHHGVRWNVLPLVVQGGTVTTVSAMSSRFCRHRCHRGCQFQQSAGWGLIGLQLLVRRGGRLPHPAYERVSPSVECLDRSAVSWLPGERPGLAQDAEALRKGGACYMRCSGASCNRVLGYRQKYSQTGLTDWLLWGDKLIGVMPYSCSIPTICQGALSFARSRSRCHTSWISSSTCS